ncbi:MAG TPA: hypothetical protein DDX71_00245 [Ruminococcus sp.]|nr:hypothetical protein [Ruminococcus sp.]
MLPHLLSICNDRFFNDIITQNEIFFKMRVQGAAIDTGAIFRYNRQGDKFMKGVSKNAAFPK